MRLIIAVAIFMLALYIGFVWALDVAITNDLKKIGVVRYVPNN
jgi:hypothetical protein